MAQQTINIGSVANDGTGDPLRTAFDKSNDNFTELYNVDSNFNNAIDSALSLIDDLDSNFTALSTYFTTDHITAGELEFSNGVATWTPILKPSGDATNLVLGQDVIDPLTVGPLSGQDITTFGPDVSSADSNNYQSMYIGGPIYSAGDTLPTRFSEIPTSGTYSHDVRRIAGIYADGVDVDDLVMMGDGLLHLSSTTSAEIKGPVSFASVPASSVGVSGDKTGMIAVDSNYMYYCRNDYDSASDIWVRTPWADSSW